MDVRKAGGDREQILHAVAHFAGKQLVAFLRLLASRHVKENAGHRSSNDTFIFAPATGSDPADLVSHHDAEVGFVSALDTLRRREGGADAVPVRGMDMCGQFLEADLRFPWQAPKLEAARIHGEAVIVDIPCPEREPGGFNSPAQLFRSPNVFRR